MHACVRPLVFCATVCAVVACPEVMLVEPSHPFIFTGRAFRLNHEQAGFPALRVCNIHFCMRVSFVAHVCPRERAGAPPSAAVLRCMPEGCRSLFMIICTFMRCEASRRRPSVTHIQSAWAALPTRAARAARMGTSAAAQRLAAEEARAIAPLPPAVPAASAHVSTMLSTAARAAPSPADGARQLQRAQCLRCCACAVQRL